MSIDHDYIYHIGYWTDIFNGHQTLIFLHVIDGTMPQSRFLDDVSILDSTHRNVTSSAKALIVLAVVADHSAKMTRKTSSKEVTD